MIGRDGGMREASTGVAGKLSDLRARLGVTVGSLYVTHRLLRRVTGGAADLEFHRLVVQPVRDAAVLPARLLGTLVVKRLAPDEPAIAEALSRADDLARRLARGDRCVAAFREGKLVGYLWLCFGPFEEAESRCRFVLPPHLGAWDYDMFIAAEERGGPAFGALWDAAWALLRERDVQWTASRISGFNDLSLRSHQRLGARPVGWLLLLRLGRCLGFAGSVPPFLKASCSPRRPIEVNFRTAPNWRV